MTICPTRLTYNLRSMTVSSNGDQHWGILGGAFDPVHNGHITLATELYRRKSLEGVLLVPSGEHPLKKNACTASFQERAEMLALAAKDFKFMEISRLEEEQELSGYTIDSVRAIKKSYPDRTFHFIIGADNLSEFATWRNPAGILKEVKLLVGSRPGFQLRGLMDLPADRVEVVETRLMAVSSTELRQRLKAGTFDNELDSMLPFAVRQYIAERKLYL